MLSLIITIFACIFYTGRIWGKRHIRVFSHANIQMSIAMCFLAGSIGAGVIGIRTKLITLGEAIDRWTKGSRQHDAGNNDSGMRMEYKYSD